MLEFEIAAIYHFVANVITVQPYFEEVPEDMITPCVFYPTPEQKGEVFSLSTYLTNFVIYVKLMDVSTFAAYQMANVVVQRLMECRCKVPIIDMDGECTERYLQINYPDMKRVDNGVYQMTISWKRYTTYNIEAVPRAKEIFFNGLPVSYKKGEIDGDGKEER